MCNTVANSLKSYRNLLRGPRVQVDGPDLGYMHTQVPMNTRTPKP